MPVRRTLLVLLFVVPLVACTSLSVSQPADGSTTCGPINSVVSWSSDLQGGLTVKKDGNDVSQQFSINNAAHQATATLDFTQGTHFLQASGTFSCWYCSGGSSALTASSAFSEYCKKK